MTQLQPIEKTKEQNIIDHINHEFYESNVMIDVIKQHHTDRWNMFWNNLDYTSVELAQIMGLTRLAEMFRISKETQTFIKKIDPSYEVLVPPIVVEFTQDGHVLFDNVVII